MNELQFHIHNNTVTCSCSDNESSRDTKQVIVAKNKAAVVAWTPLYQD